MWGLQPSPPSGPCLARRSRGPWRLRSPARPKRPRLSYSKDPKTLDDFCRAWQLGLECLQEGGLKQLSGGPCPLHTSARLIPATSFVLSSASFPLSPSRHLPVLPLFAEARLPCGVVVGPVGPGTTCWPQEGAAFSTQKILSREVLRCNKHPRLQLALRGPGLSLLIRQLEEVLDFLVAF